MSPSWVPILCYHRVCPDDEIVDDSRNLCVGPGRFGLQMRLLKILGYRAISLQDLVAHLHSQKNIHPRSVVLTFDDGYADNYRYAFPVLKNLNLTATVFLVTDYIGRKNAWDSGLVSLLSEAQIEEMQSCGIVFGSHTLSHIDMTRTDPDKTRKELEQSRKKLESLGSRLDVPFCYPYSRITPEARRLVREAGYICGLAVDSGPLDQSQDLFELRRIQVFPSTTITGFWKKIQPWYPQWLRFQQKMKGQVRR